MLCAIVRGFWAGGKKEEKFLLLTSVADRRQRMQIIVSVFCSSFFLLFKPIIKAYLK